MYTKQNTSQDEIQTVRRTLNAPINVKPQGGGGGRRATPGELIIDDGTSLGNLTILTGPRVGKFDIAAILNN